MSLGNVINLNRYTAPPQVEYSVVNFSISSPVITGITDVIFDTIIGGTIPYNTTTGEWTLTAGKTYQLEARLRLYFSGSSSDGIVYEFVDAATNVGLPGISADQLVTSFVNSNSSSIETTSAIYTPTVTQNVKLRIFGTVLTPSAQLQAEYSGAIVKEIGFSSYVPANRLRAHASLTALAPVVPASPTLAEVQTWALASLAARSDRVVYYTGDDIVTSPVIRVWWVDNAGVATLLRSGGVSADLLIDADADTSIAVEETADNDNIIMRVGDNSGNYNVATPLIRLNASAVGTTIRAPDAAVAAVDGSTMNILGGSNLSGARGGSIVARAGSGDTEGGTLSVSAGDGVVQGGLVDLYSGVGGQLGGNINIVAETGPTRSGNINLVTVTSVGGFAGSINLKPGNGSLDPGFIKIFPYAAGVGTTSKLAFLDTSGVESNHVGFRAPDVVTTPTIWQLPAADGAIGTVLSTNGAGVLSWIGLSAAAGLSDGDLDTSISVEVTADSDTIVMRVGDNSGDYDLTLAPLTINTSGFTLVPPLANNAALSGVVQISGGSHSGAVAGGKVAIQGGTGVLDTGGLVEIIGGAGALNGGALTVSGGVGITGGLVTISGGLSNAGVGGSAGWVDISGGDAQLISNVTGIAGSIRLSGGDGTTLAEDGQVVIGVTNRSTARRPTVFGLENFDGTTSRIVGFQAPAVLASTVVWTLPATDGPAGTVLSTDGAGTLSWSNGAVAAKLSDADLDTFIDVGHPRF
jgi:hypothetical protein